ncbi:hypothetical protein AFI02nite_42240 [Aliivibrio fischeri]|uniref:Transposase n=1 Tax=Aliivibrio fischeri TaxID=668 RepID=A0A510UNF9_ALIFS|nr:hypothetical protein AFI02nite_42240 [Aliivibrio fischeri]
MQYFTQALKKALRRKIQLNLDGRYKELGIELICANSSQTKGRVERANFTLQSRLVKEMRLKN